MRAGRQSCELYRRLGWHGGGRRPGSPLWAGLLGCVALSDAVLVVVAIGLAEHSTRGPNDDKQNNGLDIAHHFMMMLSNDQLCEAPTAVRVKSWTWARVQASG